VDTSNNNKKRITITISDEELAIARDSGESVSGYIGRLIRADAQGDVLSVPLPDGLHRILMSSGLMDGSARTRLFDDLVKVVVKHIDSTLLDSRAKLMAISGDAILAHKAKQRQPGAS